MVLVITLKNSMTIKSKITLILSLFFTVLYGIVCVFILTMFSNFRKEEFRDRLNEKAITSIRLLVDVKEVDRDLLKIIDQNTLNKLYNEKILIFDGRYNLIYSSIDDTKINWNLNDLAYLKENKTFYKLIDKNELFGVYYKSKNNEFYALVSANDNYGNRKLQYLTYLLVITNIFLTIITWIITFSTIKKQLKPLDDFHQELSRINELNSESKLDIVTNSKHEINLLSIEFNQMINRIIDSHERQKEFSSQVSHELRTPLARISTQIENHYKLADEESKVFLKKLLIDIKKLNDLIFSLLILSKIENKAVFTMRETVRLDEVIFESIKKVKEDFPEFRMNFELNLSEKEEELLELNCNFHLLEIALTNLFRNACIYSTDNKAMAQLYVLDNKLCLEISNTGETISDQDIPNLFQPFYRGLNSTNKNGFGLGLRIVSRIYLLFAYKIEYFKSQNFNIFKTTF